MKRYDFVISQSKLMARDSNFETEKCPKEQRSGDAVRSVIGDLMKAAKHLSCKQHKSLLLLITIWL